MVVRKRSVSIAGHATSFSLEDEFWDGLRELAEQNGLALAAQIAVIDATRPRTSNLSSAIRLYVLAQARLGKLVAQKADDL